MRSKGPENRLAFNINVESELGREAEGTPPSSTFCRPPLRKTTVSVGGRAAQSRVPTRSTFEPVQFPEVAVGVAFHGDPLTGGGLGGPGRTAPGGVAKETLEVVLRGELGPVARFWPRERKKTRGLERRRDA